MPLSSEIIMTLEMNFFLLSPLSYFLKDVLQSLPFNELLARFYLRTLLPWWRHERCRETLDRKSMCGSRTVGGKKRNSLRRGKKYETLPILFVELQHHVVSGNAEGASALVVWLLTIWLVHVWWGHGAVVGVVVGVDGATVAACQVELNI